jgi:peroxiredoxin
MARIHKTVRLAVSSAAGCALSLLYAPAGVALAVLATILCLFHTLSFDVPRARIGLAVCSLFAAGALFIATGSPLLALSVVPPAVLSPPSELVMRFRNAPHNAPRVLGTVLGALLLALAPSAGYWKLAPLPLILAGVYGSLLMSRLRSTSRRVQAGMKIRIGDSMPDVTLPYRDRPGELSFAQERGNLMLLVFVRGDWCAVCHVMMRLISREAPSLAQHGVRVLIVTPAEGDADEEFKTQLALQSGMLLDKDAQLARSLGLIEPAQGGSPEVPLPVAILVGRDGKVLDITGPEDVSTYVEERRLAAMLERQAA